MPKLLLVVLSLFLFYWSACSFASAQKDESINRTIENPASSSDVSEGIMTISDGHGIDSLNLGMSVESVVKNQREPSNKFSHVCRDKSILLFQWLRSEKAGNLEEGDGIFAYFRDNRLSLLSFSSPRAVTTDGITFGTPWNSLLKARPELQVYLLTRSSSEATNGTNRIYAIDTSRGVAFRSGENAVGERIVDSIEIFNVGEDFEPNACKADDQKFKPYTLDRP